MHSLSLRRLTSARTKQASAPSPSISRTSPLASASSMSAKTRRAPSRAKRSALARPIPLAAPVMTAAFPSSLMGSHLQRDKAAIDRVIAPRDEGGGIRAEEQGEFGDLLRPAHS